MHACLMGFRCDTLRFSRPLLACGAGGRTAQAEPRHDYGRAGLQGRRDCRGGLTGQHGLFRRLSHDSEGGRGEGSGCFFPNQNIVSADESVFLVHVCMTACTAAIRRRARGRGNPHTPPSLPQRGHFLKRDYSTTAVRARLPRRFRLFLL